MESLERRSLVLSPYADDSMVWWIVSNAEACLSKPGRSPSRLGLQDSRSTVNDVSHLPVFRGINFAQGRALYVMVNFTPPRAPSAAQPDDNTQSTQTPRWASNNEVAVQTPGPQQSSSETVGF